jgi:hypothetical protein
MGNSKYLKNNYIQIKKKNNFVTFEKKSSTKFAIYRIEKKKETWLNLCTYSYERGEKDVQIHAFKLKKRVQTDDGSEYLNGRGNRILYGQFLSLFSLHFALYIVKL